MRNAAIYSALLHAAVFALVVLGLPRLSTPPPVVDRPISVEVVTIAEKTRPPEGRPEIAREAPPPKPKPVPPRPEPLEARPQPPETVVQRPEPVPPPKPPRKVKPKVKPKPKPAPKARPPAPPVPRVTVRPRPKPVRRHPEEEFLAALKSVETLERSPRAAPRSPRRVQSAKGARRLEPNARLSESELDAVRRQLQRCWNVPLGARDAEDLAVEIHVVMRPDRTVLRARIADAARMRTDPFFRTMAESALRAVMNPRCSPLALPPRKYDLWKTFTLNFDPKDMVR